MPGRDGTGPLGEGPLTGGGFGFCSTDVAPGLGVMRQGTRRMGGGFGRGRGFCRNIETYRYGRGRFVDNRSAVADEKQLLENEMKYLEKEINTIKKRLEEIK